MQLTEPKYKVINTYALYNTKTVKYTKKKKPDKYTITL